jgi:quinol monooxygenase YgiN
MITRIVKMTFKSEHINDFQQIFHESQNLIKAFDGCIRLELMKDIDDENTFFTISHWESKEYLDSYRSSYLFKNTWSKVKPLFAEKALAWSLS